MKYMYLGLCHHVNSALILLMGFFNSSCLFVMSSDLRFDINLSFCYHRCDLKAIYESGLLEFLKQEDKFLTRLLFSCRLQSSHQLVLLYL